MQRLAYLRNGTSRFNRVIDNANLVTLKRCVSNNSSKTSSDLGINNELYKPSTTKTATHVPNELKGGQSKETIETPPKSAATLTGGGKVWSVQNPGSIHIAPLSAVPISFVPTSTDDGKTIHSTTVINSLGGLNVSDSSAAGAEATPAQLAEAAAASAFQTFAPDTPLATSSTTEPVFAPKIASTDVYSTASSPTGLFESQTSPSTEKQSNENLFSTSSTKNTSETKEIPVQREKDIRDQILSEALKYVDEKGWTMEAIRAGVRANNQPSTVEGLFSNGYDLVDYFMRDCNAKMAAHMNERATKGDLQGTRLLIDGLKYRLSLVIPYARTWDQALAQGALPQNAMRGWKNILDLSSDAWHGIGDTSTDITWYSKRLLLAAVYKSSEIYMLQDQSIDKTDTMNFLERRLSDFQTAGSVRNSVSKSLSDTAQVASGLFSVVRNLTSRR